MQREVFDNIKRVIDYYLWNAKLILDMPGEVKSDKDKSKDFDIEINKMISAINVFLKASHVARDTD